MKRLGNPKKDLYIYELADGSISAQYAGTEFATVEPKSKQLSLNTNGLISGPTKDNFNAVLEFFKSGYRTERIAGGEFYLASYDSQGKVADRKELSEGRFTLTLE